MRRLKYHGESFYIVDVMLEKRETLDVPVASVAGCSRLSNCERRKKRLTTSDMLAVAIVRIAEVAR
jgi:hypothetical protein